MIIAPTPLEGLFVLEVERFQDDRGFFARSYCVTELQSAGIDPTVSQCGISFNERAGTLRGMHFQASPHSENKLVRCSAGAIFDVAVDLRRESATFGKWFAAELSAENRRSLFIPKGFAHGFLTLMSHSEVHYMISTPFVSEAARGFRWDDSSVGIAWPTSPTVVSARDMSYPLLAEIMGETVE